MAVRQGTSTFLNVQVRLQLGTLRAGGLGLWITQWGEGLQRSELWELKKVPENAVAPRMR